jgi:hypothetical protein
MLTTIELWEQCFLLSMQGLYNDEPHKLDRFDCVEVG